MKPAIGMKVYVGGCVGEICQIDETQVVVSGKYFYSMTYSEDWIAVYNLDDVLSLDENKILMGGCYNFTSIKVIFM